jgi:hypothetical protein
MKAANGVRLNLGRVEARVHYRDDQGTTAIGEGFGRERYAHPTLPSVSHFEGGHAMTTIDRPESKARSRRALLAGALGGIGAWAASAIGRSSPVCAGVDGDVVLGTDNTATLVTSITNNSTTSTVFAAFSTSGVGLWGSSSSNKGVYGFSNSSIGVNGYSNSYYGVLGQSGSSAGVGGISGSSIGVAGTSGSSIGVQGYSTATDQPASLGWTAGNSTGVQGASGGSLPAAKAKTGVFGYAAQDSNSKGVWGESPSGLGVYGKTSTGYGGFFEGKVYTTKWYELTVISPPPNPVANRARLFLKDNGQGKTQLCVKFANGTVKVLATEG